MTRLSHLKDRLSMRVPLSLLAIAVLAASIGYTALGSIGASAAPAPGGASPYYGRWQVNDADAHFSGRGRVYKTIDIAPCGRDFCGVSVDDRGMCGATLFRFLAIHSDGQSRLLGHGVWGSEKKDITIDTFDGDTPANRQIELNLGNGHDFGERGGSMPMFNATYVQHGAAQCRSR